MPLRKPRPESPCRFADGQAIDVGMFVMTEHPEYEGKWWYSWPGRVVGKREALAVVEFIGWGNVVTRRRELPGDRLLHLADDRQSVRLYRVARYLNLTTSGAEVEHAPAIKVTQQDGANDDTQDDS